MGLTLVLAESSIELVPNEIVGHSSIVASSRRKRRDPHQLILDQSYHHAAILKLGKAGVGRGRPDITHFCLLTALGSPLNTDHQLECFVQTRDGHMIVVNPKARLPRNTDRFTSLIEQLYEESRVPASDMPLLNMKQETLSGLVKQLAPDLVVALTTEGAPREMTEVARELEGAEKPVLLVGGFSEGHFSAETSRLASKKYRIDCRRLEAWTVVGRAIYDYEKVVGLPRL